MHSGKGYRSGKTKTSNRKEKSKNMKDLFLKKLQTCMKTYDYKDENKDAAGKRERLQGIYEFFLQLIINEAADVKSLKVYVTPQFVQEFLDLFDSEEGVERDYLKNILHKLYAKLVPRRKMIRKAINECFFALIHETHKFNGAAELLDILASIISGFAVPLREEHVIFFKNVIIPLHKVQT